jgi:hypothetical protein
MLGIGKRRRRSRILRWIIISLSRAILDSLLIRFDSHVASLTPISHCKRTDIRRCSTPPPPVKKPKHSVNIYPKYDKN